MDRRVGPGCLGLAEHLARGDVHDRETVGGGGAQRDPGGGVVVRAAQNVPPPTASVCACGVRGLSWALAQEPSRDESLRMSLPAWSEELCVPGFERALIGGAQQMGLMNLGALMVEDRRLDRTLQELVGMTAEELIQSVLAGDVHSEAFAASSCPPPHLAQGGHRAGEGGDQGRVKLADGET